MLPSGLFLTGMRNWTMQVEYGTRAYWIGLALLVVVVLVVLIKAFREWQEIHDVEEPDSPDDLLRSFREAHAMGDLDDDEFERVQRRLANAPASPLPTAESLDHAHPGEERPLSSPEQRHDCPGALAPQDNTGISAADSDRPGGRDGA